MDKNIEKALLTLNELFPTVNFPEVLVVKRKKNRYLRTHKSTLAYYDGRNQKIVVAKDVLFLLSGKEIKETIYHEAGHFVHHRYFLFKAQYLPRKHHGDAVYYCNKNQKESFATCFADFVKAKKKGKEDKIQGRKRLSKMNRLLREKELIV